MIVLDELKAMFLMFIERLKEVMGNGEEFSGHHDRHIDEIIREYERINLTFEIGELLAETLITIFKPPPPPVDPFDSVFLKVRVGGNTFYFKPGDLTMSYTVKDDRPDDPFSVSPVTGAKDAEGADITADQFTVTDPVSDNEAAVSIVDDGAGGKALHYGAPGTAHVSVDTSYQGELVKHSEAAITVTTGALDPNSVQGGDLVIPGLTPDA